MCKKAHLPVGKRLEVVKVHGTHARPWWHRSRALALLQSVHMATQRVVKKVGRGLGLSEHIYTVSLGHIQYFANHGIIIFASHDTEAAPVASTVAHAAARWKAEGHLLPAAGLEKIHIRRCGAYKRNRNSRVLRLAQCLQKVVYMDPGLPEEKFAVGRAEGPARLVYPDGHSHRWCELGAWSENEDAASLPLFKVWEKV